MNILMYIRELLLSDPFIKSQVDERIHFYKVGANTNTSKPFIILTPLDGTPSTFVSDKYLSETFFVQVDVETYKHQTSLDIANRIRNILWINGFRQKGTEFYEPFEETKRYVLARRYEGIPKNKYYKGGHVE
ncbi:hypothetical protein [Mammaliicoccus vitulinus]|uniref:hypothetical protein n=1 Tax=Mammaliicoccus vitulinus TaxID=71237 RepID=UPI0039AF47F1